MSIVICFKCNCIIYTNRGGTLLQDQNSHNSITKHLPILESKLIKLADDFEKEHGRKIKIRGKEVQQMIEEEQRLFEEQKVARKLNRQVFTPLPVV